MGITQAITGRRENFPEERTGLAAALLAWFHGLRRPPLPPRMKLVETLPLGGRRQLLMVVCDGRRFLVGLGNDGVSSIVEMAGGTGSRKVEREELEC